MNSPRAQFQDPNSNYQSIDHIITEPPKYVTKAQPEYLNQPPPADKANDNYLPIEPIYLSPQEEQNLISDASKELGNYSSNYLKNFYSELTSYDPNVSGYAHYTYITLAAMRNNVSNFIYKRYSNFLFFLFYIGLKFCFLSVKNSLSL